MASMVLDAGQSLNELSNTIAFCSNFVTGTDLVTDWLWYWSTPILEATGWPVALLVLVPLILGTLIDIWNGTWNVFLKSRVIAKDKKELARGTGEGAFEIVVREIEPQEEIELDNRVVAAHLAQMEVLMMVLEDLPQLFVQALYEFYVSSEEIDTIWYLSVFFTIAGMGLKMYSFDFNSRAAIFAITVYPIIIFLVVYMAIRPYMGNSSSTGPDPQGNNTSSIIIV